MNWSRIKTALIVLFFLMNLYLLYEVVADRASESRVSPDMIATAAAVLENNQITVDRAAIPEEMPKMENVVMENVLNVLAEQALPAGISLSVQQNRFTLTDSTVASPALNNESLLREWLASFGLDLQGARLMVAADSVTVQGYWEDYPVCENLVRISLLGPHTLRAEGTWFNVSHRGGHKSRVKHVTALFPNLLAEADVQRVSDIALCYNGFTDDTYYAEMTAVPAWRISTNQGDFYYDARKES